MRGKVTEAGRERHTRRWVNPPPEARVDGKAVWLGGTLEGRGDCRKVDGRTKAARSGRAMSEQNRGAPASQGRRFCGGSPLCLRRQPLPWRVL